MTFNFENIFTYESFSSYEIKEGNQDKDSNAYNNCKLLIDIGNIKKGTEIFTIYLSRSVYIFDDDYIGDVSILDKDINTTIITENTFYDLFEFESKEYDDTHTYHKYNYINCKLLKDIENPYLHFKLEKGTQVKSIAIGAQLYGFNEKNQLIYDEIIS
jgi:uncharacterized protein (UPF0276 family)